jgi:hypothetical protein
MFRELFMESFKPTKNNIYSSSDGKQLYNWFVPKSRGLMFKTRNGSIVKLNGESQRGYNVGVIDSPNSNLIGLDLMFTKFGKPQDKSYENDLSVESVFDIKSTKVTKEEIEDFKQFAKENGAGDMHMGTLKQNGLRNNPYKFVASFASTASALEFRKLLKSSEYKKHIVHVNNGIVSVYKGK